jgi:hypothetical protein
VVMSEDKSTIRRLLGPDTRSAVLGHWILMQASSAQAEPQPRLDGEVLPQRGTRSPKRSPPRAGAASHPSLLSLSDPFLSLFLIPRNGLCAGKTRISEDFPFLGQSDTWLAMGPALRKGYSPNGAGMGSSSISRVTSPLSASKWARSSLRLAGAEHRAIALLGLVLERVEPGQVDILGRVLHPEKLGMLADDPTDRPVPDRDAITRN